MKFVWIVPCLALCACVNNGRMPDDAYNQAYAPAPVVTEAAIVTNPYALEPAAYEINENIALKQKEDELFQKEKFLLESQQELYEREKKLASREAEFINRSKALDYKEQNIVQGRSYAPMTTPVPQPVPAMAPTPVYYIAPAVHPVTPVAPIPPAPAETIIEEETVVFNAVSEPAYYEPTDVGYIIMQHPIQRDLVRCPVTDDVCLQSYERLGYIRSNNLSGFASQENVDIDVHPTNTAGQWRENSSIPRW